MGAFKEMLIERTEWLEEKLNEVAPDEDWDYDTIQDTIAVAVTPFDIVRIVEGVHKAQKYADSLWEIIRRSEEDANKLSRISWNLYTFALLATSFDMSTASEDEQKRINKMFSEWRSRLYNA